MVSLYSTIKMMHGPINIRYISIVIRMGHIPRPITNCYLLHRSLRWGFCFIYFLLHSTCRSQWSRGLMPRSVAAGLLRLSVRIPPEAWMSVWCEFCMLSGRGLFVGLIIRIKESYRLWCVVCDLENLVNEEVLAQWRAVAPKTNTRCDPVEVSRQTQIL